MGTYLKNAPKRARRVERPEAQSNQAGAQVAHALQADWVGLPEDVIATIGPFVNKQDTSRLKYVCRAFNTGAVSYTHLTLPTKA